jgi:Zn-dependent protease with chaperone function
MIGLPISGVIYVHANSLSMNRFTREEIKFILSHEFVHIMKSHMISNLAWDVLEKIARGPGEKHKLLVDAIKAALTLLSPDRLPPNALALRENEYEADEVAVIQITRDLKSSISCLTELSGNNMNNPSHIWEVYDIELPAMTLGERIEELCRRAHESGIY